MTGIAGTWTTTVVIVTRTDAHVPETVGVWDPLIRIGHWVPVAAFATAYLTEGAPQWLHSFAGYAIAVTVAVRILWP